jgi:hypothetical protein
VCQRASGRRSLAIASEENSRAVIRWFDESGAVDLRAHEGPRMLVLWRSLAQNL